MQYKEIIDRIQRNAGIKILDSESRKAITQGIEDEYVDMFKISRSPRNVSVIDTTFDVTLTSATAVEGELHIDAVGSLFDKELFKGDEITFTVISLPPVA